MIDVVQYSQDSPVQSEVEALFSVIIPILKGVLYSLKRSIVEEVGGYDKISLQLLARLYKPGDGDCGICFEYAVHDGIIKGNPVVLERIDTALVKHCKIKNGSPTSILFGAEKSGALQLIDSVSEHLTDESALLTGNVGKPIKLKKHIQGVLNAFRKPSEREKLPNSINGLWKADLFIGKTEADRWVGTTVKVNAKQLEAAKGLRLAIVPGQYGKKDNITFSDMKNLIICPMPYDQSFMEIFYAGWNATKQFLNAGAQVPPEALLPRGAERYVCKELASRCKFAVVDVVTALEVMKQPHLLSTKSVKANIRVENNARESKINTIIAPKSLYNV